MTTTPVPNVRVWLLAREYQEAADSLLDENRLQPAVILAALANEIFLKSFLAKQDERGFVETVREHVLTELWRRISENDRTDILACSMEVNDKVDFVASLDAFDRTFTQARYRYEKLAPASVGSDAVDFSHHLCETIFLLGVRRGI